jgi:hypothetical protein
MHLGTAVGVDELLAGALVELPPSVERLGEPNAGLGSSRARRLRADAFNDAKLTARAAAAMRRILSAIKSGADFYTYRYLATANCLLRFMGGLRRDLTRAI